jgi:hypothetical protein
MKQLMNKNQLILIVSERKKHKDKFNSFVVIYLAQGPLMITGPGMGVYQQTNFGAGGIYPQYGGAPGYSGY